MSDTTKPNASAEVSSKPDRKQTLTHVAVSGFKSLVSECSIEIRPLTILAGANSSGKSSIMQPLLLVKQTVEASFNPGFLLLHGPNVRFQSFRQILSRLPKNKIASCFSLLMRTGDDLGCRLTVEKSTKNQFSRYCEYYEGGGKLLLKEGFGEKELANQDLSKFLPPFFDFKQPPFKDYRPIATSERAFINLEFRKAGQKKSLGLGVSLGAPYEALLTEMLHIPALRGNPEPSYKTTGLGDQFPGTFDIYVASIIHRWKQSKSEKLEKLGRFLEKIGLTWKVSTKRIDDTQVELLVGRLGHATQGGAHDLVNISQVGFAVSQSLPVLVGLLVAKPSQVIYIEQPEIHLHPRAQFALAKLLAKAASRGVRVIVETHSSLLLLGIQALVAEGRLASNDVKLHWFTRGRDGETRVASSDLDKTGSFGDWPEDFGQIEMKAQERYLNAVGAAKFHGG